MRLLTDSQTADALPFEPLIQALRQMFVAGCTMPLRHHHSMAVPGEDDATLLLMPAWQSGLYMGVKMVSVFPGNGARNLPAIHGSYLLSSGATGALLAVIDGAALTARRTAAASALASSYLSRTDARRLLVVGAGRLAATLVEAHCSVRAITHVSVWARDPAKARALAQTIAIDGVAVDVATDLEAAARSADILSCATLSIDPLILGAWLKPGAHLDLVGAFRPSMRECDDEAVLRASLFVDTRDGALSEGGDLAQPLAAGLITPSDIRADLFELSRGLHPGRSSADEITLFKSVGAALEDLAGAILAYETVVARETVPSQEMVQR